jgi:hypothetical protein
MIGRNTHSANNLTENEGQPLVLQFQPTKKHFSLHKTVISVRDLSPKSNSYNLAHNGNESYKTTNNSKSQECREMEDR